MDKLTLKGIAHRSSKAGSSSSKHSKAKESPRKSMIETKPVDPNEFRRITRSQSKSPTKSTPKAARKTEIDREETRIIDSLTDVDAFAEVITMPNPTGDATSEAEINHAFNELNNFLDEEGMNSVDLPLGRGPRCVKGIRHIVGFLLQLNRPENSRVQHSANKGHWN